MAVKATGKTTEEIMKELFTRYIASGQVGYDQFGKIMDPSLVNEMLEYAEKMNKEAGPSEIRIQDDPQNVLEKTLVFENNLNQLPDTAVVRNIQAIENTGSDGTYFQYRVEGQWHWASTRNQASMDRFHYLTKDKMHIRDLVYKVLNQYI